MRQVCKRAVITLGLLACAHVAFAQVIKLDPITTFASPGIDGPNGTPGEVTQGTDGSFYAISAYSPTTVVSIFQINHIAHAHVKIISVDTQQTNPQPSHLVQAGDGRFYASFFADQGGGIIRYDPVSNTASVVQQFLAGASDWGPNGAMPGPLTRGHDGALYGPMEISAMAIDPNESGSLFRFDPVANSFSTLYQFTFGADGAYPTTALVEGAPGVWYGTNVDTSAFCGNAFQLDTTASPSALTPVHVFDQNAEGCGPGELAFLPSGLLTGVTTYGDFMTTNGSVFTLDPVSGTVTALHTFLLTDPLAPVAPGDVLVSGDGNIYVQALNMGAGAASILRLHPLSSALDDVLDLTGTSAQIGELTVGRDARLFGVFADTQMFALGVLDPLPVAPAGGLSGGTTTLSTTLKALGLPLTGRGIVFSINGKTVGMTATDPNGVATLNNVSLVGLAVGTYPNGVGVSFAGDTLFPGTTGTGLLNVMPAATPGLMVGDGFINQSQVRYQFKFVVQENANGNDTGALVLNITSINDGHKKTTAPRNDVFVSTSYNNVVFTLDTAARPQFDTATFSGTGIWDGQPGYTFQAVANDRIGPGPHTESFQITIYSPTNTVVASVSGALSGGSMQSHRIHF